MVAEQSRGHAGAGTVAAVVVVDVIVIIRVGDRDVARAFVLELRTFHEAGQLGRGRVDGAEGEDVQQKYAIVVEQVAERLAHQPIIRIGG